MTARKPKTEHKLSSPVDPAIARAITRANGSFAVWDKSELANLIHVAGCAAFRIFHETKDDQVLAAQDVLVALADAIRRDDARLLKSLHAPALGALADREVTLELEGKSSGFEPHLRAHGGKQRFGEYLIEVAEAPAASYGSDEVKFADFASRVGVDHARISLTPRRPRCPRSGVTDEPRSVEGDRFAGSLAA